MSWEYGGSGPGVSAEGAGLSDTELSGPAAA